MTAQSSKWIVFGESVRGASHLRSGAPNQDALSSLQLGGDGVPAPIALAVSDGHGSPKCFRSYIGSENAVRIASVLGTEFLDGVKSESLPVIRDLAEHRLPAEIVRQWRQAIAEHIQKNPFTQEELEKLERESGSGAKASMLTEGQGFLAYGSTLLLAAIGDGFAFYLQLGDGDILVVDDAGNVASPIGDDAAMIANETTSLCMKNAQQLFRFGFHRIQDAPPAMVLVSTDGYANSFSTPEDFQQVGFDLLQAIQLEGFDPVARGLAGWLNDASTEGSGDDVTVGIICRQDVVLADEPAVTEKTGPVDFSDLFDDGETLEEYQASLSAAASKAKDEEEGKGAERPDSANAS